MNIKATVPLLSSPCAPVSAGHSFTGFIDEIQPPVSLTASGGVGSIQYFDSSVPGGVLGNEYSFSRNPYSSFSTCGSLGVKNINLYAGVSWQRPFFSDAYSTEGVQALLGKQFDAIIGTINLAGIVLLPNLSPENRTSGYGGMNITFNPGFPKALSFGITTLLPYGPASQNNYLLSLGVRLSLLFNNDTIENFFFSGVYFTYGRQPVQIPDLLKVQLPEGSQVLGPLESKSDFYLGGGLSWTPIHFLKLTLQLLYQGATSSASTGGLYTTAGLTFYFDRQTLQEAKGGLERRKQGRAVRKTESLIYQFLKKRAANNPELKKWLEEKESLEKELKQVKTELSTIQKGLENGNLYLSKEEHVERKKRQERKEEIEGRLAVLNGQIKGYTTAMLEDITSEHRLDPKEKKRYQEMLRKQGIDPDKDPHLIETGIYGEFCEDDDGTVIECPIVISPPRDPKTGKPLSGIEVTIKEEPEKK